MKTPRILKHGKSKEKNKKCKQSLTFQVFGLFGLFLFKYSHRLRNNPGRKPKLEENVYGEWAWKCNIPGRENGPLHGLFLLVDI